MARKIVLTSGKGGVGKTTVCANLGVALCKHNKRVVLVDVDIGLNNLDVVTGVENKIVFDIVDVIEGRCRAKQALVQDLNYPNLYIMPSAHSYNKSQVTAQNVKNVIDMLDDYFDFILIDCPAGIDEPFKRAVVGADEAIVVVTPHLSSLRDADKVLMMLNNYNIKSINLVVNRVRGDMVVDNEMLDYQKIAEILSCEVCGIIPEDDNICMLLGVGKTVNRDCESYLAFSMLAKNVLGENSKLYDPTEKYKGIIGFFKRAIKKRV
ncbi:MAG: septum site-determining protein MinD [Clostridia bacterium]|nr:septum site-determining protein MinD [Clostridia bacterium]